MRDLSEKSGRKIGGHGLLSIASYTRGSREVLRGSARVTRRPPVGCANRRLVRRLLTPALRRPLHARRR